MHARTHARTDRTSHFAGADLDATQETGDTALSLSSFFGRPRAVAELVRRGADVHCHDIEGLAPGEVFEAEVDLTTQREIQVKPKTRHKPLHATPRTHLTHGFTHSLDGSSLTI